MAAMVVAFTSGSYPAMEAGGVVSLGFTAPEYRKLAAWQSDWLTRQKASEKHGSVVVTG